MKSVLLAAAMLAAVAIATPNNVAPLPACPTEDSIGCYWDASTRGNGIGRSFIADQSGAIHYVRGSDNAS